jgi:hypothetical protein
MAQNREARIQQALFDLATLPNTSIRSVAAAHNIPHVTLSRRAKGYLSRPLAHEHQQLLSNEQERLLKRWIIDLEAQGHAPAFNNIRELAAIVSGSSGGPRKVGKNWISRFLQRHPEIHSKVGKKIQAQRVDSITPKVLEDWFKHFKSVQERYGILPENTAIVGHKIYFPQLQLGPQP